MDSRIWSAILVQADRLGLSFQVSIHCRMSALSARTLQWVPRCSFLVVSSPNQRSAKSNQELLAGVKCRTNLGCAASHRRMAGVLWVEALSSTT